MSTTYNRRRGVTARKMRKPRECNSCGRFADGASRYCSDHRLRVASVEGPIGRGLRLRHQANQQREDALLPADCRRKRTAFQHGVPLSAAHKARNRRLVKHILLDGFLRMFNVVKKKARSPWAR
jgi:hypothetical protein